MLYADTEMAGMPAADYQTVIADLAGRLTPVMQAQAYDLICAALDIAYKPTLTAAEWGYLAASNLGIVPGDALAIDYVDPSAPKAINDDTAIACKPGWSG
jgi:hypothetical protein